MNTAQTAAPTRATHLSLGGQIGRRLFLKNAAFAAGMLAFPAIIPSRVLGKDAPSSKIQIGQIGCGRIARDHDLGETLRYTKLGRVVAVCDLDSRRMAEGKTLVEQFYKRQKNLPAGTVKTYGDYREMLQRGEIDAVMISTPDHWHAQPAIEAAFAKKDVYLQKPTSLTVVEGRQLCEAIKKSGIILQLGTQQRSMAQFRIAAELVRNGRIGKLRTVRIGLPGDPSGPVEKETPPPATLNYDAWLGSTPLMPYIEKKVHPQRGYGRPGWLRVDQFGAGMITGWGQHHFDSAAWGMDTELTGPVWVEAEAEFPKSGIWDVHGKFFAKAGYANGVEMFTSSPNKDYRNGIRYEGDKGWIFVSRGNYTASASDPVSAKKQANALDASDPAILLSKIGPDETHLYKSSNQHANWLECIKTRKAPISPVEAGHRACTVCLITHIAMRLRRRLEWDPAIERFKNDDEANKLLRREQRKPYGTDYLTKS
ncbi:MAG: Gfo/Idh/MocA family oxidoreductase [Puniceicoccales bacterium]|jgi:predicted dehydrogenase|nr:Gfo/Idh/MocA family oxidoreductase [Puniceicoccales bacterium]